MGLFTVLARWFGGNSGAVTAAAHANGNGHGVGPAPGIERAGLGEGRAQVASAGGDGVDDMDAEVIEPGGPDLGTAPIVAPKNRAELINELKKNYTEVLGIVRKVDQHLDGQQGRADRMLAIAEESARRLDMLPELVEQNRRVADAILQLVEVSRQGQADSKVVTDRLSKTATQQLEATQQQTAVLYTVQSAVKHAGEAERELAGSVTEFKGSLGEMTRATGDLGRSIATMRETDAAREEELARLVRSGQRWLVVAVLITGLLAVGTLVAVLTGGF